MQPMIICAAPAPGMICLNGRFAGEVAPGRELFAPISPWGPVYLEYRPLSGTGGALARKLVLSGGLPLAESLADAAGLCCVAWPGGALEVEFTPFESCVERFLLEGLPCALTRGEATTLTLNGADVALPPGVQIPRLLRLNGAAALLGNVEGGGQYLATLSADLSTPTGLMTADSIEEADGGLFSAFAALEDGVGHGRLEQWLADAGGLHCVSAESTWSRGGPHWPAAAGDAVIAAVEAALIGLTDESEGYLSPALSREHPLTAVSEVCDLCTPMKYGFPDARPCVALVKAVNDHLATVRPLYYSAEPSGGRQGPWQITSVSLE